MLHHWNRHCLYSPFYSHTCTIRESVAHDLCMHRRRSLLTFQCIPFTDRDTSKPANDLLKQLQSCFWYTEISVLSSAKLPFSHFACMSPKFLLKKANKKNKSVACRALFLLCYNLLCTRGHEKLMF